MKIEIPLFDLSTDRIKDPISHYIIIESDHVVYHLECYIDKIPDIKQEEYDVIEDQFLFYHGIILREFISAVDLDFTPSANGDDKYDCYSVEISVTGMAARIRLKFETQEKAQPVLDILTKYILKQPFEAIK